MRRSGASCAFRHALDLTDEKRQRSCVSEPQIPPVWNTSTWRARRSSN